MQSHRSAPTRDDGNHRALARMAGRGAPSPLSFNLVSSPREYNGVVSQFQSISHPLSRCSSRHSRVTSRHITSLRRRIRRRRRRPSGQYLLNLVLGCRHTSHQAPSTYLLTYPFPLVEATHYLILRLCRILGRGPTAHPASKNLPLPRAAPCHALRASDRSSHRRSYLGDAAADDLRKPSRHTWSVTSNALIGAS